MYDADAHPGLRQASLAARSQLRSLAHIAYGTTIPYAEVTPWAYIHGLATLVLMWPALGSGTGRVLRLPVHRILLLLSMGVTGITAC